MNNLSDTTKHWLTGLLKTLITAISTTVSVMFAQVTVTSHVSWKVIGMSVVITSITRMAEYLKNHPLPGVDIVENGRTLEISKPTIIIPKDPS